MLDRFLVSTGLLSIAPNRIFHNTLSIETATLSLRSFCDHWKSLESDRWQVRYRIKKCSRSIELCVWSSNWSSVCFQTISLKLNISKTISSDLHQLSKTNFLTLFSHARKAFQIESSLNLHAKLIKMHLWEQRSKALHLRTFLGKIKTKAVELCVRNGRD